MQHDHTSKQFDAQLDALRARVLQMGELVETQIVNAVKALRTGDMALINQVIRDERAINDLEIEIDEQCSQIIARRQPAAGDLRMLIMAAKTITDLERIGDEAKKIALTAREIYQEKKLIVPRYAELLRISEMALKMLRMALNSFARLELDETVEVLRRDAKVDKEFRSIVHHLITCMMEDPRTISAGLAIIFAAKSIERIGDHAKNITEQVVYMVKGKDVRHNTLEEIKREVAS